MQADEHKWIVIVKYFPSEFRPVPCDAPVSFPARLTTICMRLERDQVMPVCTNC